MTCTCGQGVTSPVRATLHHIRAQALTRQANSLRCSRLTGKCLRTGKRLTHRAARSRGPMTATAMINVDGSPPLFLGAGMIVAGAVLYQLRNSRPYITKDFDIVLSCIALFSGGILVFQGWRLDPLLLFGQLLTAGAALSFGVEALRLREIVHKKELSEASSYDQQAPQSGRDPRYPEALPLPRAWDQAQPPAQPGTSSLQESRPWWEEQRAGVAKFDRSVADMPGPTEQGRQQSWSSSPTASSPQTSASSPNRPDRQQLPQQQQQQQQQQQRQQQSPPSGIKSQAQQQKARTQKSWGSDIDLSSLDDWDSD